MGWHQAVSSRDADRFEYATFADRLGNCIKELKEPEGYLISVTGPWGSGKSSVLSFLKTKLEQDGFAVATYNPWMLSGTDHVVEGLITEIICLYDPNYLSGKLADATTKQSLDLLGNLGNMVAPAAGFILKVAASQMGKTAPLSRLKEETCEALRREFKNKRIAILIDDIDRLSVAEIRHLFGAIKALADLPHVLYIAAFDQRVVETALADNTGISGTEYLEKIVQAPFQIPYPSRHGLGRLLVEKLTSIWGEEETEKELVQNSRFWNLYHGGLKDYLKTPRNVLRLTNTIRLTYAGVRGQVCPTDFFAIETLRLFEPKVYDVIRTRPDLFAGEKVLLGKETETYYSLVSALMPAIANLEDLIFREKLFLVNENRESEGNLMLSTGFPHILLVLASLFPRLGSIFFSKLDSYDEREMYRRRRVASVERFWNYFGLVDSLRFCSQELLTEGLQSLQSQSNISALLKKTSEEFSPSGATRALHLLESLERAELNSEESKKLLKSVFSVGDEIWRKDLERVLLDRKITSVSDDLSDARSVYVEHDFRESGVLLHSFFSRVERNEQTGLLTDLIGCDTVLCCATLIQQVVKDQTSFAIGTADLDKFRAVALGKIKAASETDRIYEISLPKILRAWAALATLDEVRSWVAPTLEDPTRALPFLLSHVNVTDVKRYGKAIVEVGLILDRSEIGGFADPRQVEDAIDSISDFSSAPWYAEVALKTIVRSSNLNLILPI